MPDLAGLSTDGPLARTVADAALLLDVMTGNRPGDMYTLPPLPAGETFLGYARREPGRLRIGRTLRHAVGGREVHPDCVGRLRGGQRAAGRASGTRSRTSSRRSARTWSPRSRRSGTRWRRSRRSRPADEERLLPLTRYLRERGRATSAADLIFAQAYLQFVVRGAWKVLNEFDAVLTPTLACRPPRWATSRRWTRRRTSSGRSGSRRTRPLYNVSGQPAVSLPLHWTDGGLPIGVMLAGRMGDEATLISLSAQIEAARPWRDRHPSLW